MRVLRTDSDNLDFRRLVVDLDRYLADIDGADHAFYAQFNGLDNIPYVVVAYEDDIGIACGAFKPYGGDSVEIKRMFTLPKYRGKRVAARVLCELEKWAAELGYGDCVLETGHRQQAAVSLYRRSGYEVVPNYGQYTGIENSLCMRKSIAGASSGVSSD